MSSVRPRVRRRRTTPSTTSRRMDFWSVRTTDGRPAGTSVRSLRAGAIGQLSPDFEHALRSDPGLAALVVHVLLDREFPESLHADICAAAGIDVERYEIEAASQRLVAEATRRRRSTTFRIDVLEAYE